MFGEPYSPCLKRELPHPTCPLKVAGWAPELVWTLLRILPPPGSEPRVVQPLAWSLSYCIVNKGIIVYSEPVGTIVSFILYVQCSALNYGIVQTCALWLSSDAADWNRTWPLYLFLLLIAPIFNYSSCSNNKGMCKIGSCGSEWRLLLSFNLPARA